MIKAIQNKQNPSNKKDNEQIKNSSEYNKLIANDNKNLCIQNERKFISKNKNKKRKFYDIIISNES